MEKKTPYWQQLRDPRWQQKRLKIMERDRWRCRFCSDTESTLNVHHRYYEKGLMAWDYPDWVMDCVCEGCHEMIARYQQRFLSAMRPFGWIFVEHLMDICEGLKEEYEPDKPEGWFNDDCESLIHIIRFLGERMDDGKLYKMLRPSIMEFQTRCKNRGQ